MQFNGNQPEEHGGGNEPNADPPRPPKMSPLPKGSKHGSRIYKRSKLLRKKHRYSYVSRSPGYSGYSDMAGAASRRYNRFLADNSHATGFGQKRTQAHSCTSTSESETTQQDAYFYMQRKRQAVSGQRHAATNRAQAQDLVTRTQAKTTGSKTQATSNANPRPQTPQRAKKGNKSAASSSSTSPRGTSSADSNRRHHPDPQILEDPSQTGTLKQLLHVISSLIDKQCPCSQEKDPEQQELSHAEETEARLQAEWEHEQELHMEPMAPMAPILFNVIPMDQERLHLNATFSAQDSAALAMHLGQHMGHQPQVFLGRPTAISPSHTCHSEIQKRLQLHAAPSAHDSAALAKHLGQQLSHQPQAQLGRPSGFDISPSHCCSGNQEKLHRNATFSAIDPTTLAKDMGHQPEVPLGRPAGFSTTPNHCCSRNQVKLHIETSPVNDPTEMASDLDQHPHTPLGRPSTSGSAKSPSHCSLSSAHFPIHCCSKNQEKLHLVASSVYDHTEMVNHLGHLPQAQLGRPTGSTISPSHSIPSSPLVPTNMANIQGHTSKVPLGRPSGSAASPSPSTPDSPDLQLGIDPASAEVTLTEVIDVDKQATRKRSLWPFYSAFTQEEALDLLSSDSSSFQLSTTLPGGGQERDSSV